MDEIVTRLTVVRIEMPSDDYTRLEEHIIKEGISFSEYFNALHRDNFNASIEAKELSPERDENEESEEDNRTKKRGRPKKS
jgi:hypothetical protein